MEAKQQKFKGNFEIFKKQRMKRIVPANGENGKKLGFLLPYDGGQAEGYDGHENRFLVHVPTEKKGGKSANDQTTNEMQRVAGTSPELYQAGQHRETGKKDRGPGTYARQNDVLAVPDQTPRQTPVPLRFVIKGFQSGLQNFIEPVVERPKVGSPIRVR